MFKFILKWLHYLFVPPKKVDVLPTPDVTTRKLKVLFILKYREVEDKDMGVYSCSGLSSGLFNSARMVNDMMNEETDDGFEAKMIQVVDNNCIDREVTAFQPDVVIIEAFWVVPEKFDVLQKLHPKVKWIIRNHSNFPFLAQEGIAMRWIGACIKHDNVYVATNTKESLHDLREAMVEVVGPFCARLKLVYFPNYYRNETPDDAVWEPRWRDSHELHVGCFGAIRPLKNHLVQAVAAIKAARKLKRDLVFHVNSGRYESGGLPVIHNLRGLFGHQMNATLVEHTWMPHDEFLRVVASMDIALQVSLSETFNIVTADAVMMDVPVVVSPEVFWVDKRYQVHPNNANEIASVIVNTLTALNKNRHHVNVEHLLHYNYNSKASILNTVRRIAS